MLDRETIKHTRKMFQTIVLEAGKYYISEQAAKHAGAAVVKLLSTCLPAPYSGCVRTGIEIGTFVYTKAKIEKIQSTTEDDDC